jgi:hypothetical protein
MNDTTTNRSEGIAIPRLHDESLRAYAARVAYLTMGPGRSLAKLAERGQSEGEAGMTRRLTTLEAWSVKYGWQELARQYDQALANLAAREHAEEYRRQLEAHRVEAFKVSAELIALGRMLAAEITHRRNELEYKPSDLAAAIKAMLVGFDLRAHALDLPRLMAVLDAESR